MNGAAHQNQPLELTQDVCCTTTHLGKGARCALPLHPSGPWLRQGIKPVPEPTDRIADQSLAGLGDIPLHLHRTMDQRAYRRPSKPTRKGAFGAPLHPIDLTGVPAPKTPDHFMETTPWRPCHGDDFIETNRSLLDCAPNSGRLWITRRQILRMLEGLAPSMLSESPCSLNVQQGFARDRNACSSARFSRLLSRDGSRREASD